MELAHRIPDEHRRPTSKLIHLVTFQNMTQETHWAGERSLIQLLIQIFNSEPTRRYYSSGKYRLRWVIWVKDRSRQWFLLFTLARLLELQLQVKARNKPRDITKPPTVRNRMRSRGMGHGSMKVCVCEEWDGNTMGGEKTGADKQWTVRWIWKRHNGCGRHTLKSSLPGPWSY